MTQGQPSPDIRPLLMLYRLTKDRPRHRPPWVWSVLTETEALLLYHCVDEFVVTYNWVFTRYVHETVPPCWPHHRGLATVLPVLWWAYYQSFRDPRLAHPAAAQVWMYRSLVDFRSSVQEWLGEEPHRCRANDHPPAWRDGVDKTLEEMQPLSASQAFDALEVMRSLHAGFDIPSPRQSEDS